MKKVTEQEDTVREALKWADMALSDPDFAKKRGYDRLACSHVRAALKRIGSTNRSIVLENVAEGDSTPYRLAHLQIGRPSRIEVTHQDGVTTILVFEGVDVDPAQEPVATWTSDPSQKPKDVVV